MLCCNGSSSPALLYIAWWKLCSGGSSTVLSLKEQQQAEQSSGIRRCCAVSSVQHRRNWRCSSMQQYSRCWVVTVVLYSRCCVEAVLVEVISADCCLCCKMAVVANAAQTHSKIHTSQYSLQQKSVNGRSMSFYLCLIFSVYRGRGCVSSIRASASERQKTSSIFQNADITLLIFGKNKYSLLHTVCHDKVDRNNWPIARRQ